MKPEWRDDTGRPGADKIGRRSIKTKSFMITVMDSHIDYPGMWIMCCHAMRIDNRILEAKTLEEAKIEAVTIAKNVLGVMVADMELLTGTGGS